MIKSNTALFELNQIQITSIKSNSTNLNKNKLWRTFKGKRDQHNDFSTSPNLKQNPNRVKENSIYSNLPKTPPSRSSKASIDVIRFQKSLILIISIFYASPHINSLNKSTILIEFLFFIRFVLFPHFSTQRPTASDYRM